MLKITRTWLVASSLTLIAPATWAQLCPECGIGGVRDGGGVPPPELKPVRVAKMKATVVEKWFDLKSKGTVSEQKEVCRGRGEVPVYDFRPRAGQTRAAVALKCPT